VTVGCVHRFIAVSEKRPDGAQASVYNLRNLFKKKALSTPEVASQEFVAMCFSPDDSLLLTLGGAPDWTLCSWMWDKGKVCHKDWNMLCCESAMSRPRVCTDR
jgi:cilia- and flagella-associated protein 57